LPVFSSILVPLDGGDIAAGVLPTALALARATHTSLCLLTVVEENDTARRAAAEANLSFIAAGLRAEGVTVEVVVRAGTAATEIIGGAAAAGADLIAMATRGRGGLTRALLGSVAERVVKDSPTPVLLLRPGGHPVAKVGTLLVPVDGTPGSAHGLATAVALARLTKARLALVQVVEPIHVYPMTRQFGREVTYGPVWWDKVGLEAADQHLAALVECVRREGIEAEGQAVLGAPVAEFIDKAADRVRADLIVMSTRVYTGPARALLGSVADAVVRGQPRPVLLVQRAGPSPQDSHRAAVDEPAVGARGS
jgi:nucleotide-binding universal stress UspA family protein